MSKLDLEARLLYRDSLMLVIDKPAGLPVHAGPGGGDNLEAHFDQLKFGLPKPPALAHRLDRDTSGCLVLGRHRKALSKLGRLFQGGKVEKAYWALTATRPKKDEGYIDAPLKKVGAGRGWTMTVADDGQKARTRYKVLGEANGLTWIEASPRTGRTHQIRVHLAHLGCPIIGDPQYGGPKAPDGGSLFLHARAIELPLYPSRDAVRVEAEAPDRMLRMVERFDAFNSGKDIVPH